MCTRIILLCIISLQVLFVQAQEKVEVIISDTVLQSEKENFAPGRKSKSDWEAYLRNKINPLVLIDNNAPAGRYTVIVQYKVERDGTTINVMPLTSNGYGMEQEVIRTIRTLTRWAPATQDSQSEKTYRRTFVTFIKTNESYNVATTTPYILYIGLDNQVTVKALNVKPKRLKVIVSENATIKRTGDFVYTVKVKPTGGRVDFTLKDKRKVLSTHSIETKLAPTPDQ